MKKILFVAFAATLLAAGCQKTEIINPVNPYGTPAMTFTTGISKLTKSATASGEDNLQTQGFVLSAVNAYDDVPSERLFNQYYDGLDNKPFTFDNGWVIEGNDSYFWPGKDRDLVFFAVSSAQKGNDGKQKYNVPQITETSDFCLDGTTEGDEGIYSDVIVKNFVITDYAVVPPTYTDAGVQTGADDDLMVADVVKKNQDTQKNGVKGVVDLAFNHTLSKVEFVFSTNPQTATKYPVVINSVVVNKVVKTADLNIDVTFEETEGVADNVYDWNAKDASLVYATADDENSEPFTIDYDLNLTAADQTYATWLVIPQDLDGKTITISYTIKDAENEEAQDKNFVSVWPLKVEGLVDEWGINKYVRYKVNLSPHMITFNPYLDNDWDAVVNVDPSTGEAATIVSSIIVGETTYYFNGTELKVDSEVFELEETGFVKTTATSITTETHTYTLAAGKVTNVAVNTAAQE